MCKILDEIDVNSYGTQPNGRGYNTYKKLNDEVEQLAVQMPWNTTEIQESIHIEDSAKYSRNKLDVFGNLKQETREGYNFFNINTITENKYIVINSGTLSTSNVTNTSDFMKVKANQSYIFVFKYSTLASENKRGYCLFDTNKQYLSGAEYVVTNKKVTISPSQDGYIKVSYDINCTDIMFIEGTEEKPYEQYGAMPSIDYPSMPVVATGVQKITRCRKNFWKFEYAKIAPSSQTWFFFDGKPGAWGTNIQNKTECYIKLKPGFYAFSYIKANNCILQIMDNNEKILINTKFPQTIELKKDTYIIPRFRNIENNVETYVEGLQIEKVSSLSDTATTYEPYTEEIFTLDLADTELCKITDENGNVVAQDRAVYREVDGVKKWQWEKYILKAVMNSKSEFTYNGLKNNTTVDFISPVFKNLPTNVYSPNIEEITRYNYLKPNSTTATNKFRISVSLADLGLEEFTTKAVAEQALKDLIAKKGDAIIYYKATEPIYEDCTPSQSEVLDKLYKLQLEQGTNNIFVESENGVTTELQLTYMQDLQSKLNQLEAMIVANASEEV